MFINKAPTFHVTATKIFHLQYRTKKNRREHALIQRRPADQVTAALLQKQPSTHSDHFSPMPLTDLILCYNQLLQIICKRAQLKKRRQALSKPSRGLLLL